VIRSCKLPLKHRFEPSRSSSSMLQSLKLLLSGRYRDSAQFSTQVPFTTGASACCCLRQQRLIKQKISVALMSDPKNLHWRRLGKCPESQLESKPVCSVTQPSCFFLRITLRSASLRQPHAIRFRVTRLLACSSFSTFQLSYTYIPI
jgi:hypothetical protein